MLDSPVWEMEPWSLEADLAKIGQQWGYLRGILEDAAHYELRDPDISGWSCGEHAGHIAMVTLRIAAGIEQNLLEPQRDADGKWAEPTAAVLEAGDFPRGAAKSPAHVDPAGRPRSDFLPLLPEAERAWAAVSQKSLELPECPARFPHFILGYLTSPEWVRFCALHTAHHLAVVRDIRAAAV